MPGELLESLLSGEKKEDWKLRETLGVSLLGSTAAILAVFVALVRYPHVPDSHTETYYLYYSQVLLLSARLFQT